MLLDGQACGRNDHVAGYMFGQSLHAYDKGGGGGGDVNHRRQLLATPITLIRRNLSTTPPIA